MHLAIGCEIRFGDRTVRKLREIDGEDGRAKKITVPRDAQGLRVPFLADARDLAALVLILNPENGPNQRGHSVSVSFVADSATASPSHGLPIVIDEDRPRVWLGDEIPEVLPGPGLAELVIDNHDDEPAELRLILVGAPVEPEAETPPPPESTPD